MPSGYENYTIRQKTKHKQTAAGLILFCLATGPALAHEEGADGHLIPHEFAGLNFDGGTTWFLQATSGAKKDTAALTYTLDLSIEKEMEGRGKVAVAFEAGDGEGVDPDIGTLSAVNYDAFFTELTNNVGGSTNVVALSISQAYYENEWGSGRLVIDVGKLDVHSFFDDNAFANDETDQYLSAIFTRSADTSYKQLDFYYAPAIALQYQPVPLVGMTLIAANGNKSGFSDIFNQMYYVGQINFMPGLGGYEGNYRVYALLDNRDSVNTTFTRINSVSMPDIQAGDLSKGKREENTAWGLSFDQALPGDLGVFARFSSQDDKFIENLVESSWSFGALVEGKRWGRKGDSFGVAYGSVNVNKDPAVLAYAGLSKADDETHFEVFYKCGYKDHYTITPDIQVINNIGGDASADSVIVYGVRSQLNF